MLLGVSCARLELTDGVREWEEEASVRDPLGVGEDDLPTNPGGIDGGSGRRLGVRMRTLRDGLGGDVGSDVLRDGVGDGARLGVLREDDGVGDGARLGRIDSVDSTSTSTARCSSLSLCRTGSAAGAVSRTGRAAAAGGEVKVKLAVPCRADPRSRLGAAPSPPFTSFSSVGCASAEGATSLVLAAARCNVGARVRNVTLRPSGLSVSMGRYCDCGLNPDEAFRRVFSRMVSISCCKRPSAKPRAIARYGPPDELGGSNGM